MYVRYVEMGTSEWASIQIPTIRPELAVDIWDCSQGWRIRGFEGARAPPERTSAPPHRQKHPLKIKEKLCKIPCDTKMEQKYGYLRLNLGK